MGPTRCTPVALSYKGSEADSNLGPVANNRKNIASGRQSLGMMPRNFRPCGRQRTPSVCRQWSPVYGLIGVPPLLWVLRAQNGARSWGCQDSEMQYLGEKVWGCGLGIFDLVGCNGSCQHVGLGR